jgi:hypothetical protein
MFYWAFATWSAKLFGKKNHADEAPAALEAPADAPEQH